MGIGPWQIVLILLIVVIIFGAGKLPRVMGDLAKGIKNFKSGMKEEMAEGADKPSPPIADSTTARTETTKEKEDAPKS